MNSRKNTQGMQRPFDVRVNFGYEPYDLADAVVQSRAIQAFDSAVASYPIHRLVRCAARRPLEQVFDDLALKSGLVAQRLRAGSLLLDGKGVFVQAEGRRKAGYCSCTFAIWAESIELAEATRDSLFRIVGDERVRDQLFIVDWRFMDRSGDSQASSFEEVADDVLLDEAYPMLGEPVEQFIDRYVRSEEPVLILLGPPGTGKTRLLRAILGALSRRKGDSAEVLYTADPQVLKSDGIFVDFVTGSHDAFVIEDADYLLQPRSDGNLDLHRFLMVADGVVRAGGRKLVFTTNLPNAGAIDDALLRPGRCFATLTIRRLSVEEARRLARRLSGDLTQAERIVASAMQPDSRSISTAAVYSAWQQEQRRAAAGRLEPLLDGLHVDGALVRERLEPEHAMVAAHAALVDATEGQLVLQVVREEAVDRHATR
jgi:energy-coupling factor transporter ATP-binding protein EcfA2